MDEQMVFIGDTEDPPVPVAPVGSESEQDVSVRLSAARASLSSTDWTIETIVRQMKKGRIDLNPKFQRRAAWTDATKSRFIESAILMYPIPQLVLAESQDRPGHFFVIDGKQRLLALRQFYAGRGEPDDEGFEPASLTGLSILEDLKGFDINDLESQRTSLFDAFENHTIRTVVIRDWKSEEFLFTLFLRLNTGSVALSPQELRQALVPGPFVDYVDVTSGESAGLQSLLGNDGPDRRMVDAELLVRFLGFSFGLRPYRGNLKVFLDDSCREFNDRWASKSMAVRALVKQMEMAIEAAQDIFGGEHACHKWSGTRYERSFNKAIFDIQIASLVPRDTREAALKEPERIVEEFRRLCTDDPDFSTYVSTTTKSLPATVGRFEKWFEAVSRVTKTDLKLPRALHSFDGP